MTWEIVAQEAVRTIVAGAGGVAVAGAEGVLRAVGRRIGVLSKDPETMLAEVRQAGERDPEFAAQVSAELAVVSGDGPVPARVAPSLFFDRAQARVRLSEPGVHLVAGAYGVGKTALVLRVREDAAADFPGGSAYVDLDDHRVGEALPVADVQIEVLRQLGIEVGDAAPAEVAAQYRRALVLRRTVLVLENALGVDEVRELAQPWPGSLVLVTVRRLTDDLWAWAPNAPEQLHELDDAGAREMLEYRCPGTFATEPEAAAELLQLCDRVPFAILQATVLINRRRGGPRAVAAVRDLLAGSEHPGDLVERCLSSTVAGLRPGDVDDLAGLAWLPVDRLGHDEVQAALGHRADALVDAGLLIADQGWLRMPRLVRNHARRLRAADTRVLDRLITHYRDCAVAIDLTGGDRLRCYPVPSVPAWPGTHAEGLDRLESAVTTIAALVPLAHRAGRHLEIIQLCGALEPLLTSRGHHGPIAAVNVEGMRSAGAIGQRLALSRIRAVQGRLFTQLGMLERAAAELDAAEHALDQVTVGDEQLLARTRSSLTEFRGSLAATGGDHAAAALAFRHCLAIDERYALHRGAGLHHRMLAGSLIRLDRPQEAIDHLNQAAARTRDGRNAARVRMVAARAYLALDDLTRAASEVTAARQLATAAGARRYEIEFADLEAELAVRRGDAAAARSRWGWIAQGYWEAGDRRFDEYLAKLNQLPPPPR